MSQFSNSNRATNQPKTNDNSMGQNLDSTNHTDNFQFTRDKFLSEISRNSKNIVSITSTTETQNFTIFCSFLKISESGKQSKISLEMFYSSSEFSNNNKLSVYEQFILNLLTQRPEEIDVLLIKRSDFSENLNRVIQNWKHGDSSTKRSGFAWESSSKSKSKGSTNLVDIFVRDCVDTTIGPEDNTLFQNSRSHSSFKNHTFLQNHSFLQSANLHNPDNIESEIPKSGIVICLLENEYFSIIEKMPENFENPPIALQCQAVFGLVKYIFTNTNVNHISYQEMDVLRQINPSFGTGRGFEKGADSQKIFMQINPNILKWLDVIDSTDSIQQTKSIQSHFVKKCVTPAGKRKIKEILSKPLNNLEIINARKFYFKNLTSSESFKFLKSVGTSLRLVSNIQHCARTLELQHLNNDSWVMLIRQVPVFVQILSEILDFNRRVLKQTKNRKNSKNADNGEKFFSQLKYEDPFRISSFDKTDEIDECLKEITELRSELDEWVYLVSRNKNDQTGKIQNVKNVTEMKFLKYPCAYEIEKKRLRLFREIFVEACNWEWQCLAETLEKGSIPARFQVNISYIPNLGYMFVVNKSLINHILQSTNKFEQIENTNVHETSEKYSISRNSVPGTPNRPSSFASSSQATGNSINFTKKSRKLKNKINERLLIEQYLARSRMKVFYQTDDGYVCYTTKLLKTISSKILLRDLNIDLRSTSIDLQLKVVSNNINYLLNKNDQIQDQNKHFDDFYNFFPSVKKLIQRYYALLKSYDRYLKKRENTPDTLYPYEVKIAAYLQFSHTDPNQLGSLKLIKNEMMHFLFDKLFKYKIPSLVNAYDIIVNLDASIGLVGATVLGSAGRSWVWAKYLGGNSGEIGGNPEINKNPNKTGNPNTGNNPIVIVEKFMTPSLKLDKSKEKLIVENSYQPRSVNSVVCSIFGKNGAGKTVLLKTIGQFLVLSQCGLPISAQNAILNHPVDRIVVNGFPHRKELRGGNGEESNRFDTSAFVYETGLISDLFQGDEKDEKERSREQVEGDTRLILDGKIGNKNSPDHLDSTRKSRKNKSSNLIYKNTVYLFDELYRGTKFSIGKTLYQATLKSMSELIGETGSLVLSTSHFIVDLPSNRYFKFIHCLSDHSVKFFPGKFLKDIEQFSMVLKKAGFCKTVNSVAFFLGLTDGIVNPVEVQNFCFGFEEGCDNRLTNETDTFDVFQDLTNKSDTTTLVMEHTVWKFSKVLVEKLNDQKVYLRSWMLCYQNLGGLNDQLCKPGVFDSSGIEASVLDQPEVRVDFEMVSSDEEVSTNKTKKMKHDFMDVCEDTQITENSSVKNNSSLNISSILKTSSSKKRARSKFFGDQIENYSAFKNLCPTTGGTYE